MASCRSESETGEEMIRFRFSLRNIVHVTLIIAVSFALGSAVGADVQNAVIVAIATAGIGLWAYATGLATRIP